MTDLCGARVITITEAEMEAVLAFIKDTFVLDKDNCVDVRDRLGASEFGYRSVHYIVQFRPGTCMGVKVPKEILPMKGVPFKAEIQVRTVLQHGWSEVLHDRIYKNSIQVPEELKREGARLAALLEQGDDVISKVVNNIDAFVVDIGAYMSKKAIGEEIDKLELIRKNEKALHALEILALRIAKMRRAISDWPALVKGLKPYAETANAALLREYGNALCEANADKPGGDPYTEGQAALVRAVKLEPTKAEAHAVLARSYQRQARAESRAREHFQKAYHLAPKNPYHFATYVEYELLRAPSGSLIPTLTPVIREAIATCAGHVRVGIELPQAYLAMGKLHLLLGEAYVSLDAYAKGLRMVLDPTSGACPSCLERELDALARLENAQEGLPGDTWAREALIEGLRRMLQIGLCLATGDRKHVGALEEFKAANVASTGRVLMVAGGCKKGLDAEMNAYAGMLEGAVKDFEGTIIGGGTTAGVSGLVGSLAKTVPGRRFTTIGYYPARMASALKVDKRYDVLKETPWSNFSPLDAIQAWIDIISAGITPDRVAVLGMNGGDISGFEYRLGLALGASVGVIAKSGRAADALLEDTAWRKLATPLGLVNDPMTLRAFVNPGDGSVPPEKLDPLAKAVHIDYCKTDPATLNKRILKDNGQPWDKLKETFKNANFAQAAYIGEILKTEGYVLRVVRGKANNSRVRPRKAQIERMAEKEHGRWNVERLRDGWTPGKRNDEKKTHDCLIPWAELPDDIKEFDRNAAKSWPRILADAGIEVRKG
jgi:tetratricopeptide (TPR) repeat protein